MSKNVVLIVLDTVRRDALSVYNDDVEWTENLEGFAEEALVFEEAVAQAPWTLPSHASIFTGMYPWEHGAHQRNVFLEPGNKTLAEVFGDEGYETAAVSYNAYFSPELGLVDGFDRVETFSSATSELLPDRVMKWWHRTVTSDAFENLKSLINRLGNRFVSSGYAEVSDPEAVTEYAKEFAENADGKFFMVANYMEAHEPYYPDEKYRKRHAPEVDPSEVCHDPARHLSGDVEADFESIRKLYNASVDQVDDAVGELIESLDLEETAVIVCSDHGQLLGEDGMYGHQFSVAEELVHVPLIAHVPGKDSGRTGEQLELRQLYWKLQQWAGFDVETEDVDTALGGYELPDLASKTLKSNVREKYYRSFRFARRPGKKLVETSDAEGDAGLKMIDLETGEEIEVDPGMERRIRETEDSESGKMLEDQDEEVKERLEKLGYLDR